MRTAFIGVFVFILIGKPPFSQDVAWEFEKEKDGISVYTRDEPGTAIKALKMTGIIEGPSLSAFAALFEDLENLDNWAYSNYDSRLLEQVSPTEIIYYAKSDFPWPLSNRDFVLRNWYGQDSTTGAYYSISKVEPDYLPENKKYVRVTSFESSWSIMPQDDGTYFLEYIVRSDPAGNIPAWLINLFIDVGPFKTIQAMRKEVQKEKYATAIIPYIRE
jgi:hypothetical protein